MKKILISGGVVVVIALYAIFASHSNQTTTINSASITSSVPTTTIAGSNPPNSGITTSAGQYKDGSYTGPITDAIYGKIQVIATIENGRISSIQIPVYPNEAGHTIQVSNQALPTLEQEAIQSQSANVDIVSGATQTSQAFEQSLAAALAMAK